MRQVIAVMVVLAMIPAVLSAQETNQPKKFDYGPGPAREGWVQVLPAQLYSDAAGFGFEPGGDVEAVDRGGDDLLTRDFCTSQRPFYFSVKLPEGNYRIQLTLGDVADRTSTTVKAELRRLMLENVRTESGKITTRTVIVNVRTPQLASGGEVRLKDRERTTEMWAWDNKLTLEFSGTRPCLCGLEIESVSDLPTVYLLGDSTVCDQPREPFASWGQMLPRFFDAKVAVANHAESGESLKSSRGAKRLEKVLGTMRKGDWLLIQFGHNDMKAIDAAEYKAELKRFVAEAREKGGLVVLVSPMHRRTFNGPKITNSHRDFPDAVRSAAAEEQVPLIDLHAMSQQLYEAWGPEESVRAFANASDGTHHSNYGAYELARCVVEAIRKQESALSRYIDNEVPSFDPSRPDAFSSVEIPASPGTGKKPDGN